MSHHYALCCRLHRLRASKRADRPAGLWDMLRLLLLLLHAAQQHEKT
jgi:hypothetical protein